MPALLKKRNKRILKKRADGWSMRKIGRSEQTTKGKLLDVKTVWEVITREHKNELNASSLCDCSSYYSKMFA